MSTTEGKELQEIFERLLSLQENIRTGKIPRPDSRRPDVVAIDPGVIDEYWFKINMGEETIIKIEMHTHVPYDLIFIHGCRVNERRGPWTIYFSQSNNMGQLCKTTDEVFVENNVCTEKLLWEIKKLIFGLM